MYSKCIYTPLPLKMKQDFRITFHINIFNFGSVYLKKWVPCLAGTFFQYVTKPIYKCCHNFLNIIGVRWGETSLTSFMVEVSDIKNSKVSTLQQTQIQVQKNHFGILWYFKYKLKSFIFLDGLFFQIDKNRYYTLKNPTDKEYNLSISHNIRLRNSLSDDGEL